MPIFAFHENDSMYDITPIENLFINEYMLKAPGSFVKVYLYGLFLCYNPDPQMTLLKLAKALDMEEAEVRNAYSYWERQGIIVRKSDNPPTYSYYNLKARMLSERKDDDGLYQYKEFNHKLQSLFGSERLLHPAEYSKIYEWHEEDKLPQEVIFLLIEYLIQRRGKKFTFKSADEIARQWATDDIRTVEKAQDRLRSTTESYKNVKQLLSSMGTRANPNDEQLSLYDKWTKQFGFGMSEINFVRASLNTDKPNMRYLDTVLTSYYTRGTVSLATMEEANDRFQKVKEVIRALGTPNTTPTDTHLEHYTKWLNSGMSHDAIMRAAAYTVYRSKTRLEDLDRVIDFLVKKGLTQKPTIDRFFDEQDTVSQLATSIFNHLGETRLPSSAELVLIKKWMQELSMSLELVLLAADFAVNAKVKLPYMDKLITSWHGAGINTIEQAKKQHSEHTQSAAGALGATTTTNTRPSKEVAEHRYTQRTYQNSDFEDLFVDFTADPHEGENK